MDFWPNIQFFNFVNKDTESRTSERANTLTYSHTKVKLAESTFPLEGRYCNGQSLRALSA